MTDKTTVETACRAALARAIDGEDYPSEVTEVIWAKATEVPYTEQTIDYVLAVFRASIPPLTAIAAARTANAAAIKAFLAVAHSEKVTVH